MTLAEMTAIQQAKFVGTWIKRLTVLSTEVKRDFRSPGKMDSITSIFNRLVIGIENYGEKAYGLTEKQIAFVEDTFNDELKFLNTMKRLHEMDVADAQRKADSQAVVETPVEVATEAPAPRSQIDWERLDTMTAAEIHGFDKDEWDASVAEFEAEGDSFLEELKDLPFPPTSETRRLSVTIPENLYYEVEVYRLKHDLQNWTQALVEIAANALGVSVRLPSRGGARPGAGKKKKSGLC